MGGGAPERLEGVPRSRHKKGTMGASVGSVPRVAYVFKRCRADDGGGDLGLEASRVGGPCGAPLGATTIRVGIGIEDKLLLPLC